ncbi:MAG: hypothetical protein HY791_25070 [Deltaproteobacteria bacterium]|nr:hypothetical protein [Deltaproteobacteria bacterium]
MPLPEDIGSFEVVRVEPGRAIVWNDEKFIEVVDGLASELERPTDVSISSLAWSPELGLVIGDGFGSVWVDDRAGEWRVLGSDNTRYWTPIVRSVPGGVLFQTGGGGPIRALDIESGLCPDGPALPGAPLALEPFGDGFLAVPRGFRTGTPRSSALLTVEPHCSDS